MIPAPVSTQALLAGTRLEDFVIERVLGSGGLAPTQKNYIRFWQPSGGSPQSPT
jgi:hypothetical protein